MSQLGVSQRMPNLKRNTSFHQPLVTGLMKYDTNPNVRHSFKEKFFKIASYTWNNCLIPPKWVPLFYCRHLFWVSKSSSQVPLGRFFCAKGFVHVCEGFAIKVSKQLLWTMDKVVSKIKDPLYTKTHPHIYISYVKIYIYNLYVYIIKTLCLYINDLNP